MNNMPIDHLAHQDKRLSIPSAELEPILPEADKAPIRVAFERRNRDLDPQLVWRGKDPDQETFAVEAPPLYLQEHVHPKAIIEDFRAGRSKANGGPDLFAHFGLDREDHEAEVEFYRHSRRWSNRMILGDSLAVMASLAEREALRGQVQCIYIDPPYGIRFNSNFQWSTTSRDVKDGDLKHLTREPEQVKAFRDTWRDGIHSYLAYLRDRLVVARELLTESGSCFVQIGDENVHRVRAVMDEVFGEENFCAQITYKKTTGAGSPAIGTDVLAGVKDYLIWFAKDLGKVKYRQPYKPKEAGLEGAASYNRVQSPDGMTVRGLRAGEDFKRDYLDHGWKLVASDNLTSQTGVESTQMPVFHFGQSYRPTKGGWKTNALGLSRLTKSSRVTQGGIALRYVRNLLDFAAMPLNDDWQDTSTGSFTEDKVYVVQSGTKAVARCLLMTTDPGDLVLDPTCGSGTTATVAEQWGRRWITIDTSRVALALARARIMGARYPYYLLADSPEGQAKEAAVSRRPLATVATQGDIRQGFVYERVPHVTLKSIANNAEIDTIWERTQPAVDQALCDLNRHLLATDHAVTVTTGARSGRKITFKTEHNETLPSGEVVPTYRLLEWEVPRDADRDWHQQACAAHARFWEARIARQREIDASIAARADFETLYDRPYEDRKKVRVAGPFTVESLSPHRAPNVDDHGEPIAEADADRGLRTRGTSEAETYQEAMLDNLRRAGVHQAGKADRIVFTALKPWPGHWVAAEGRYQEGEIERRAAILIGPEYGTVARPDLVAAAREAADAGMDVLIACAFNFDAMASEFDKLGAVRILRARMNPDLHMADLKAGGGNLFTVFGDPDIEVLHEGEKVRVRLNGLDIFKPATGDVVTSEPDEIACWFIDTDYNEEAFFVRHAYFPGADLPYKSLRASLKAEVDEEAWESLKRTVSRPFPRPKSGRIAVKVINHLGDEVMKVMGFKE